MNRKLTLLAILLAATWGNHAFASDVIQKVGKDCPTGTYSSGDYCKSYSSTTKRGTRVISNTGGGKCPVGWYTSGNYCKAYGKRAASENVIEKAGDDCPTGMYPSGGFCKSYR